MINEGMRAIAVLLIALASAALTFTSGSGAALAAEASATDPLQEAFELDEAAGLHRDKGEYAQALPLYRKSLAIVEKVFGPDHPDIAVSLNNLAVLYRDMGENALALPLYERSLAIREKAYGTEHPSVATALNNLAALYQTMGEYAAALPLYRRGLAIRERAFGPDHPNVGVILNNLASLYRATGEYVQALPLYQRSLAIAEKALSPDDRDIAMGLSNLATLHESMGELPKALPLYERSLAILEKTLGPDHPNTGIAVNNLALVYRDMDEFQRALPLYERTLAIWEKSLGPEHPAVAIGQNNLAALYRAMGDYAKARPLYERVLARREKTLGPRHPDVAVSLNNLAALYENTGEYEKALQLYRRALPIAAAAGTPEILWKVHGGLRIVYARRQEPELAIFFGKEAINIIQTLRGQIAGMARQTQRSFLDNKIDAYRELADLLIAAGRLAEAQQVLSMLKEEELFDFIRRNDAEDPRKRRIELVPEERPWHERLQQLTARMAKVGQAMVEQRTTPSGPEQLAVLTEEDASVREELGRFYGDLDAALAALRPKAEAEAGANVRALQHTLAALGPGTVAVQYVQAESRLNILVTTATAQLARQSPITSVELNRKIEAFRRALNNPRLRPQVVGAELYQALIAPIAEDLAQAQARTLMISPDGALRYIPYPALYDGERYLIERYAIAIYTELASDNLAKPPSARRSIAGLGLTHAVEEFDALPAVKSELQGIVKRGDTGLISGELRFDEDFNMAEMRRALAGDYPLMHIASHFVFRPGTEANSFLLLGDGERLTLSRIRAEKLDFSHLDLLTLSACETGLGGGRNAQGEEIEGFGTLVQKQGAKGVIATLWPVADESTGLLMQRFYRGQEERTLNKAEALRQAQVALIRDEGSRYSHPFFWAPFILMGNWL